MSVLVSARAIGEPAYSVDSADPASLILTPAITTNNYLFIRHGEAYGNAEKIFMGQLDDERAALTREGVISAIELREEVDAIDFDVAYSSPLKRAFHTAMISLGSADVNFSPDGTYELIRTARVFMAFKENGDRTLYMTRPDGREITLEVDKRLSERSFGVLTGYPREGIETRFPQYEDIPDITKSFRHCPRGGEDFTHMIRRIGDFLIDVEESHNDENVLVYTHHGPIRVGIGLIEGLSEEDILRIKRPHTTLNPCPGSFN